MEKISLKEQVIVVDCSRDCALLSFYGNRILLKGEYARITVQELFPLLQNPVTFEELSEAVSGKLTAEDLQGILHTLRQEHLLYQTSDGTAVSMDGYPAFAYLLSYFSDSHQRNGESYYAAAQQTTIGIHSCSSLGIEILWKLACVPWKQICICDPGIVTEKEIAAYPRLYSEEHKGMRRDDFAVQNAALLPGETTVAAAELSASDLSRTEEMNLLVVVSDWYRTTDLLQWNRSAKKKKLRWLCVLQDYFGGTIGPVLGIEGGPCFSCLLTRKKSNQPNSEYSDPAEHFFARGMHHDRLPIHFPLFNDCMAALSAVEIIKLATGIMKAKTLGGLYACDSLNFRIQYHDVLQVPFCRDCSSLDELAHYTTKRW